MFIFLPREGTVDCYYCFNSFVLASVWNIILSDIIVVARRWNTAASAARSPILLWKWINFSRLWKLWGNMLVKIYWPLEFRTPWRCCINVNTGSKIPKTSSIVSGWRWITVDLLSMCMCFSKEEWHILGQTWNSFRRERRGAFPRRKRLPLQIVLSAFVVFCFMSGPEKKNWHSHKFEFEGVSIYRSLHNRIVIMTFPHQSIHPCFVLTKNVTSLVLWNG